MPIQEAELREGEAPSLVSSPDVLRTAGPRMFRARSVIGVGLLALFVLGGWLARSYWWPEGSENMFVVTDGTPINAVAVCTDTGEILWRIVTSGNGRPNPKAIPYGEVPPGFKQEVPHQGAPRNFVKGELLQVHVFSETRHMGDLGRATGPREFRTLVNFGGPRAERIDNLDCRGKAAVIP